MKRIPWIVTIAGALALSATAQQPKPLARWANLNQLAGGSEIRVVMTGGKTVRGFLQSVSPESLAIIAPTSQAAVPRQDIRLVALQRPGHRGRNTLIGLSIGAAGGLVTGAVLDRGSGRWFPNLGKEILTPLGALIGSVVGVAIPTGGWKVVYRVP